MNFKLWLEGLAAAALTGGLTGAGQVISGTGKVNTGTAVVAGIGAIFGALAYLRTPARSTAEPADAPKQ